MNYFYELKKRQILLVVCNALDDSTRINRRISSDSPAASRKVIQMCQALKKSGVRPYILSLGRGSVDGTKDYFSALVTRIDGIPIIYAPFSHFRVWSQILSFFGLIIPLQRLSKYPNKVAVFYNRLPAYLLTLWEASRLGYRNFLDLEDGELLSSKSFKQYFNSLILEQFEIHCSEGALLACRELQSKTALRPIYSYYGVLEGEINEKRWHSEKISCLMSGTLNPDQGASLLIEAIRRLRGLKTEWSSLITFEVTGKGDSLADFKKLEAEPGFPIVRVHGRTTNARYQRILRESQVGLSLKLVDGKLANTTFPSKVVEFAGSGLLVISTDISDVRSLLGDGAKYVADNDPNILIEHFFNIVNDRRSAELCASMGYQAIKEKCAPESAGLTLQRFFFE